MSGLGSDHQIMSVTPLCDHGGREKRPCRFGRTVWRRTLPMDELLTIAGTVAAVQLLFAVWREWRSARGSVPPSGGV